jgi:hypothetical protein
VTEEDFRRLAEGEIGEEDLAKEAEQRIAVIRRRIRETELTGQEVYEIYQRISESHSSMRLPVTLDGIWQLLTASPYLRAIGCAVTSNLVGDDREPLLLAGVPGIADGTALTTNRALYDEGVESLGARLRFATYGEPVFDALLELTETWDRPPCVRRISVTPPGLHNEYVGYVAAVTDAGGGELRLVLRLDDLEEIELDEGREVTEEDAEAFVIQLQAMAAQEYKLSGHVAGIESDNELSGRAQAALVLGVAYGLITGRQKYGNADDNFWKELDGVRNQIAERTTNGGALRVMYIPSCLGNVAATAFLPFEVKQKISDDTYWIERAPAVLLDAAVDAATRVADGIKRKKSELTTEVGLTRLTAEMDRIVQA